MQGLQDEELLRRAALCERLEVALAAGEPVDIGVEARRSGLSVEAVAESLQVVRMLVEECSQTTGLPLGGSTIGPYTVLDLIGSGAMGYVFRAWDPQLRRTVALKLTRNRDDLSQQRALREARALSRLRHPNLIGVHAAGVHGGMLWIAMDYVEGADLGALLQGTGPLSPLRAARISLQVAEGLAQAHLEGVVHRDVKPENVILAAEGQAYLADFGIASGMGMTRLTATGALLGTPAYFPPEQARGARATPQSDLYSLGATLYALLTGEPPFREDTLQAQLSAVLDQEPCPPSTLAPLVPAELDELCLRALAKDPAERGSLNDLAAGLRAFLDRRGAEQGPLPAASRAIRWGVALSLLGWLVAGGLALGLARAPEQSAAARSPERTPAVAEAPQPRPVLQWSALRAVQLPGPPLRALGAKAGWSLAFPDGRIWDLNSEGERLETRSFPGLFNLAAGARGGRIWVLGHRGSPVVYLVRDGESAVIEFPPDDLKGHPLHRVDQDVSGNVLVAAGPVVMLSGRGKLRQCVMNQPIDVLRWLGDSEGRILAGWDHHLAVFSRKLDLVGPVPTMGRVLSVDVREGLVALGNGQGQVLCASLETLRWCSPPLEVLARAAARGKPADPPPSQARTLAIHPTRDLLAAGTTEGWLFLWELRTGALLRCERVAKRALQQVCWSGDRLLVCTDRRVFVTRLEEPEPGRP